LKKTIAVWVGIMGVALFLSRCDGQGEDVSSGEPEAIVFWNHNDSVGYVGIQTCRGCHADIYESYIQTGMGKSFDLATREKSALPKTVAIITDSTTGLNYQMFFRGDSLVLKEYRLNGRDTTHLLFSKTDYIVGSGQHTNSHLVDVNGYVHQMPFTYYTQSGIPDLPPGFEGGHNTRFSRLIGLECMSCHNSMPTI
jgi:hypothetical protein